MFWRNQSKHPLRQKTPKNRKKNLEQLKEGDYQSRLLYLSVTIITLLSL